MRQPVLKITATAALAVAAAAGVACAAPLPAAAQAPPDQAGRYQVVAAPGAAGAAPVLVMVDTATGQSWVLVQTPGPPVQWAPVRFWTPGNPPVLVPLPPVPAAIGATAASSRNPASP